jgi:hypothetical protein
MLEKALASVDRHRRFTKCAAVTISTLATLILSITRGEEIIFRKKAIGTWLIWGEKENGKCQDS